MLVFISFLVSIEGALQSIESVVLSLLKVLHVPEDTDISSSGGVIHDQTSVLSVITEVSNRSGAPVGVVLVHLPGGG